MQSITTIGLDIAKVAAQIALATSTELYEHLSEILALK